MSELKLRGMGIIWFMIRLILPKIRSELGQEYFLALLEDARKGEFYNRGSEKTWR